MHENKAIKKNQVLYIISSQVSNQVKKEISPLPHMACYLYRQHILSSKGKKSIKISQVHLCATRTHFKNQETGLRNQNTLTSIEAMT
jgi:hypothetical protein